MAEESQHVCPGPARPQDRHGCRVTVSLVQSFVLNNEIWPEIETDLTNRFDTGVVESQVNPVEAEDDGAQLQAQATGKGNSLCCPTCSSRDVSPRVRDR